jgi:hypothetical protein
MTVPETLKPKADSVGREFEELEQDILQLDSEKLSAGGRERLSRVRERMLALRKMGLITGLPQLRLKSGAAIVASLQQAEGGAYSSAQLGEQFNLSAAVLYRRRNEHRIVYWRDPKNSYFYPRWQFNEAGALLPGIQEILQDFKSQDEWRIMRYFLGPRKQLGNRRPLDLIRAGEIEAVLAHAQTHAAENTW